MTSPSTRESFKVDVADLRDRLTRLIHEGNIRKVIVKREDETIAEFPLTAGVVAAVIAPLLAAIGAIAALVADCTVEVERAEQTPS
jgi:hypothetical protein